MRGRRERVERKGGNREKKGVHVCVAGGEGDVKWVEREKGGWGKNGV